MLRLLKGFGLFLVLWSGSSEARLITQDEILGFMQSALPDPQNMQIQLFYIPQMLAKEDEAISCEGALFQAQGQSIGCDIIYVDEKTLAPQRRRITGRVVTLIDLPVLKRRFQPSEVITSQDITWKKLPEPAGVDQHIMAEQDLAGKSPKRVLMAGEPIRHHDVALPILIKKGTMVHVVYDTPTLHLTLKAKALEDGTQDQTISFQGHDPKKTIMATVTGAHQAVISV